ncbi:MAG: hypothetical protein LBF58_08555 [Deltaproteobacteria bacterium]|nr:hypothetical protein [Deltaproteobacteria bacterium]
MTVKTGNRRGARIGALIVALLVVSAWGWGCGEAQAQLRPLGQGTGYPILKDKDFRFFLKASEYFAKSGQGDPSEFLRKNRVTEEYMNAVMLKITMNARANQGTGTMMAGGGPGDSLSFTSSEAALYRKYEKRILKYLN